MFVCLFYTTLYFSFISDIRYKESRTYFPTQVCLYKLVHHIASWNKVIVDLRPNELITKNKSLLR